ncbi:MAG: AAA family ATPase [Candidatus Marsarchaeota archaeon]|jgi:circadian clock protein KaiC|nr:AAA family ATPase [Candidatus Marsarchaeota archaeon]
MRTNNGNRFEFGIFGFDSMLSNGMPYGNQVLIAGSPGCGKTLMAFEIIYRNAIKGNPGLIILFEQKVEDFIDNVKDAFSDQDDIDKLIENKVIKIINIDIMLNFTKADGNDMFLTFKNIVNRIEEEIKSFNPKCVVIDSISLLKFIASNENILVYRKSIFVLITLLHNYNITAFFTIDNSSISREELVFQPEFYIFDGVIMLYAGIESIRREFTLEILKIRGAAHSKTIASYIITARGFSILSNEVA